MHCLRGIGIGKKILKILGKNIKTKIFPFPLIENENKSLITNLNKNLNNYINSKWYLHQDNLSKFKNSTEKVDKIIKDLLNKAIILSTKNFYNMYFIESQIMKNTKIKKNLINLGCHIKPIQNKNGMKIISVKEESHAEKQDFRVNDIITEINDIKIKNIEDFTNAIKQDNLEMKFKIKLIRNYESKEEAVLEKCILRN